jgi:hypothetical protein
MRRILGLIVSTTIVLGAIGFTTACDGGPQQSLSAQPSESPDPCAAITSPTRVQVLLPPGSVPLHKNAYLLTDPAAVNKLIAFINLRRDVSPRSADTPPSPTAKVMLYGGSHSIAVFGSGPGVFYFQCGTIKGTRYASATELADFEMLIASPADQTAAQ